MTLEFALSVRSVLRLRGVAAACPFRLAPARSGRSDV